MELEIRIDSPRERVWKALIEETTFWWPRTSTRARRKASTSSRDWVDASTRTGATSAGAVWYTVFALNPNTSLDLQGAMAVPYGPAFTLLHLALEDDGAGTMLKLSDSTLGESAGECDGTKEQGWMQVFSDGLKAYVEKQSRKKGG